MALSIQPDQTILRLYVWHRIGRGNGQFIWRQLISRLFILRQVAATAEIGIESGLLFGLGLGLRGQNEIKKSCEVKCIEMKSHTPYGSLWGWQVADENSGHVAK